MKLVILDRDGVINEDSDNFIKSTEEWIPIEGSIEAIARLHKAGFTTVVATNQSGIGRGLFDTATLDAMHNKMITLVETAGGKVAGVFYCPHHPDDNCNCRKPKSGLIDLIEKKLSISANQSVIIGDSLRDLQAGVEKGCRPILVKTGKGEKTLDLLSHNPNKGFADLEVFNNLFEATTFLIDNQ